MDRASRNDGCPDFQQGGFARRDLLKIGSLGVVGLSLPSWLRAADVQQTEPRAKSVLFYHHYGAPSHLDTFDPKPEAPARGPR